MELLVNFHNQICCKNSKYLMSVRNMLYYFLKILLNIYLFQIFIAYSFQHVNIAKGIPYNLRPLLSNGLLIFAGKGTTKSSRTFFLCIFKSLLEINYSSVLLCFYVCIIHIQISCNKIKKFPIPFHMSYFGTRNNMLCTICCIGLVERHGYSAEEHYVTTQDDYKLIHRISGIPLFNNQQKRTVVVFQHGLLSTNTWVIVGAGKDLGE